MTLRQLHTMVTDMLSGDNGLQYENMKVFTKYDDESGEGTEMFVKPRLYKRKLWVTDDDIAWKERQNDTKNFPDENEEDCIEIHG